MYHQYIRATRPLSSTGPSPKATWKVVSVSVRLAAKSEDKVYVYKERIREQAKALSGGLQASQALGAMEHKIVLETTWGRLDRIYANDDD